jgi:hypothetical protein
MNELEIDRHYFDNDFISIINNAEIEKLQTFFNFVLENYSYEIDHNKISSIQNIILAFFGNDIDANHFYRQIKYLINKGCYNRLVKKFKNDLINLNFEEIRVDLIVELIKNYYEKIVEVQKKDELHTNKSIVNFEIKTKIPVANTNYKILNEKGELNKDMKKQNILMKLKLDRKESEENLNLQNNFNDEVIIQMDKSQLVDFYEEIEKIQEKLDMLY